MARLLMQRQTVLVVVNEAERSSQLDDAVVDG